MILVAGLLALAAWLITMPRRPVRLRAHAGAGAPTPASIGPIPALVASLRGRRRRRSRGSPVATVLVEVSARMRAGATMAAAWKLSMPVPEPAWGPVLRAAAVGRHASGSEPAGASAARRQRRRDQGDVAAAAAACRLAQTVGSPLAEVAEEVVAGIAEAAEAEALRRQALAGPRASARLLGWLPVAGIVLGMAVGADPLGVLMGGGIGPLCLLAGVALFAAGNRWVAALIRGAERSGR